MDTISRQAAIDAIDKIFPAAPMLNDYTQGIACGAALATEYIKQVPSAQPEQRWIPCSSGNLPQTTDPVNITWVNRYPPSYYSHIKDVPFTATGHYHKGKWWWYSASCQDYLDEYGESEADRMDDRIEVIAWQPLPEPYKET